MKRSRRKENGQKNLQRTYFPDTLNLKKVRLLSIDPSVGHLGWAVHDIEREKDGSISINIAEFGSILVSESGIEGAAKTIDALIEIFERNKITAVTIEDYTFIPGKTKGMYVVPGMIMLIKYVFHSKYKIKAEMIDPSEWKKEVIGTGKADKDMIKTSMMRILSDDIVNEITERFAAIRKGRKGDYGEQDCYDAIGLGLYAGNKIIENMNNKILGLYSEGTK